MDPLWVALAEFWWIGPAVVGAGTVGWLGLRGQRSAKARRLAYDASREALRTARQDATAARIAARVARAELARAQAERAAGRVSSAAVAAARRAVDVAQRELKAASAAVRARRAGLSADRAALGARPTDPAQLPLARLIAADDAVTARWMDYETDAAKLIAFPAMSDARVPETAAFLAEQRTARALRPASAAARITPAQFGAYRDAIARATHAFDAAEAEAWRRARGAGTAPAGPGPDTTTTSAWVISAQEIAQNLTQTVIARGAEALARATAPRQTADQAAPPAQAAPRKPAAYGEPGPSGASGASGASADSGEDASHSGAGPSTTPPPPTPPVWPVPSRSPRSPRC
ncbi:MAG: hypothetical protein ABS62_01510 [Microbacterium sp. SCN 70-200]|uniref:hypothetical protein n=1 Tax=unclassified Microbacterium TaxID=2609290 RepID=UPI00086EF04D|nr:MULTISPECIES: hypothetical protein [unclassified Microbacterium]MBN9215166.1 hypothetical protein [Microbacterium sp.]ODT42589.1 MAG: hypothetical protein ABS62_01510 [Microbacterium sp. SCN 70-200]OJV80068.1 MAG: hypothetical protein BGO46_07520 [Microbacterium sp. 70-16]